MFEALIAAIVVALLSVAGAFLFGQSGKIIGTHRYILPVAVGIFLGVVFFELIPETLERSHEYGPVVIVVGFLAFYALSHILRTYHSHEHPASHEHRPVSARLLLMGDAVHNIADGVVIASAFAINPAVGVATTVGVALHELPQEIAEFGVLIAAGYSRLKAALYNLLSASSIILGVLLTFLIAETFAGSLFVLTGIAAGNLLYIASSDFIPELRESHAGHFWQTFLSTVLGVIFIALVLSATHGEEGHGHEEEEHEDEAAVHLELSPAP